MSSNRSLTSLVGKDALTPVHYYKRNRKRKKLRYYAGCGLKQLGARASQDLSTD